MILFGVIAVEIRYIQNLPPPSVRCFGDEDSGHLEVVRVNEPWRQVATPGPSKRSR
jgi:hypothetical protein